MLPPPAPISDTSMNGSLIGWPPPLTSLLLRLIPAPTSYSLVRTGRPFSTIAAFAVVPPMSSEISCGCPVSRPRYAQAMTPAAGPDSTRWAGFRSAVSGVSVPPADWITSSGAVIPAPRSCAAREAM